MGALLIVDLVLLIAAGAFKFHTVTLSRRNQEQYAELLRERQRLHDLRAGAQTEVERLELEEREATNDVRDLVRELSELDAKIEKLQQDLKDAED